MAMLIAWQVINKVTYPQDKRFSKNILVIAPGLTVKNRLEVLVPGSTGNYFAEFQIVPPGLEDKLRQGQTCRVLVRNWHKLDWESEEQLGKRRSVDKRGALSDEGYVREVLGEMQSAENLLVINDEAHHAWRVPPKVKIAGVQDHQLMKLSLRERRIALPTTWRKQASARRPVRPEEGNYCSCLHPLSDNPTSVPTP